MKGIKIFFGVIGVVVMMGLTVTACGNGMYQKDPQDQPTVIDPVIGPEQLEAPTNLRFIGTVAYWNSVSNSSGYVLSVNGNTHEVNATQYNFLTLPEMVSSMTYIVMVKAKGNGGTLRDSEYSPLKYYTHLINGNAPEAVTNMVFSDARYDVVAAPQPDNLPIIMQSVTDGTYNYYLLDIGYIKNVPISYGNTIKYMGQTPLTVSFTRTSVEEHKVEESISKTISESTQVTHMNELGGKLGVETVGIAKLWGAKITAEVEYKRTWGTVTDNATSTTSTYTTANSIAQSLEESIVYTVGEHGEAAGFYRLTLFATCDVYYLLTTKKDNSQIVDCIATMCARPNTYFALDYDAENIDGFGKTSISQEITFANDYYKRLPLPPRGGNIIDFAGGNGTTADPYLIDTDTHLNNARKFSSQSGVHFKLNKDISLSGSFEPIPSLNGTFDGNNKKISGLNITSPAEAIGANIYLGLFRVNSGTVKNVAIANPQISVGVQHSGNGWIYAGPVCGQNNGLITDVTATNVYIRIYRDKAAIGGIAGTAAASTAVIKNCQVSLSDTFGENADTGGIIGQLQVNSRVENCMVTGGTITHYSANTSRSVGGIVGVCDSSKILSCSIGSTTFRVTNKQHKPAIGILCGSLRNGSEINACGITNAWITSWGGYKNTYYRNEAGSGNEDKMFKVCDGAVGEQKGTNTIK